MSDHPERATRTMSVIPEGAADGRAVLEPEGDGIVVLRGENGPLDFACGGCGAILIEEAQPADAEGVVVRCSACGSFNETGG